MTKLRALGSDEAPPKPLTLLEAIETGDPLVITLAARREMAADLPDEKGPARAALYRQLLLATDKIEALKAKASGEAVPGAQVDDENFDAEAI